MTTTNKCLQGKVHFSNVDNAPEGVALSTKQLSPMRRLTLV
jgi:hypothetical protein